MRDLEVVEITSLISVRPLLFRGLQLLTVTIVSPVKCQKGDIL